MTSFRFDAGGLIDRSSLVEFSFDGKTMQGHAGDTLASALSGQRPVADGPVVQVSPAAFGCHRRCSGSQMR